MVQTFRFFSRQKLNCSCIVVQSLYLGGKEIQGFLSHHLVSIALILKVWLLFSRSVVSDSFQPRGLQHARLPRPSLSPQVCSNLSFELMMPSNHLILCRPLILPSSMFSSIRVFSSESVLLSRWSKHWSFSFSISPSSGYSGLISFRMDWLDLLQSKGLSIVFSNTTVQKHQFFSAQLSLLQSTSQIHI